MYIFMYTCIDMYSIYIGYMYVYYIYIYIYILTHGMYT